MLLPAIVLNSVVIPSVHVLEPRACAKGKAINRRLSLLIAQKSPDLEI